MTTIDKVELLDCTLRDGGYLNDWKFGYDSIEDMIKSISTTGTNIIEIGFLKDEPYDRDRTVFNSMDQVKKLISPKRKDIKYAVMSEVVNPLPLEKIAPYDGKGADIIRVIVWKTKHDENGNVVDALKEGFEYCKGIVEKGYKLCVQPARVDQYSHEEFLAMIQLFASLNPLAIYVVDSWGTQTPEKLLDYMRIIDNNLPVTIKLGYHGHNNLLQALSTAQMMIKIDFKRSIMIDASVFGIGRGAGNLNLELLMKYLNEEYGCNYDCGEVARLYDSYIKKIFNIEKWGYSIQYYLTAKYNCNPAYARKFENIPSREFEELLKSLNEVDRVIFKNNRSDEIYKEYKAKNGC